MKKGISKGFFTAAVVLNIVAMVALLSGGDASLGKVCWGVGFVCLGIGAVLSGKQDGSGEKKD